jgi:UDP-N-acetyl-D-galactosamine dehydrogenase
VAPNCCCICKKIDVIGFDISIEKVNLYKQGIDLTKEVGDIRITNTSGLFTSDEKE